MSIPERAPASAASELAAAAPPGPADRAASGRRAVVQVSAELGCLHCGRHQGTLEAEAWPPRGTVLLRRPAGEPLLVAASWQRLRCASCGGPVVVVDITRRRIWLDVVDWAAERPRRERPPKALVAARRAAGDAA
jgi:hypothetical protein